MLPAPLPTLMKDRKGAKSKMSSLAQTLMPIYQKDQQQPLSDIAWQGDDMSPDKDNQSTRIMFHNVNGLNTTGVKGIDIFAHEQNTLQVDLQGFPNIV